ncbi:MAG TPA: c-type cytochrome [Gammaproteobacteria bacterium]|nr:c-type cytochrome [Gammaproteobacteria bacterium]
MAYKEFLPLGGGGAFSRLLCVVAWLAVGGQCLAQGSASAGQGKAAVCAACHGSDGNSINPLWPSLAGQHPEYVTRQIVAFKAGDRADVLMTSFAAPLSDQDVADLAAYFASQTVTAKGADASLVELGERVYRAGDADRGIPACIACHGPAGQGNPLAGYPVVAGQHATYVVNTLKAYAAGTRRSDAAVNLMMRDIAAQLSEDEMQAVASYMQGLH